MRHEQSLSTARETVERQNEARARDMRSLVLLKKKLRKYFSSLMASNKSQECKSEAGSSWRDGKMLDMARGGEQLQRKGEAKDREQCERPAPRTGRGRSFRSEEQAEA